MPAFFFPQATDDEQAERLYQALAEFAGCEPDPIGARVRRVTFLQDGVRWAAEVGELLSGERVGGTKRAGRRIDVVQDLTSTTKVLAVYGGKPCFVVTDAQPITGAPSPWANPLVVEPEQVDLFDRS
jgi:hypothetical protein